MNKSEGDSLESDSLFLSVSSVCLSIVEILGIVCNSVILVIYHKYSRLRTARNLLIFNLALCHLLLATLEIVLSLPSSFLGKWLYGTTGCVAYGFGHHYLISVEVCSLAVIAFDRFCVITKPVRNRRIFMLTKTHVRLLILTIHLYSLAFTFPPLIGWNEYVPDGSFHTGCYVDYGDREVLPFAYTMVLVAFTRALPFALTAVCYARIYLSVKNSSKRSTLNTGTEVSRSEVSSRTNLHSGVHSRSIRSRSRTHTRTARMIAVVMASFLATWLPFSVAGLCRAFGVRVSPLVVYVCVCVAKSCVMYNAVVYVFLNQRFRAAFLHFTFICRDESKLRMATSVINQSGNRFGEIDAGITTDKFGHRRAAAAARGMVGKKLSQLSFVSVGYNVEVSSVSAGKVSADATTDVDVSIGGARSRVNVALEFTDQLYNGRTIQNIATVPEEHNYPVMAEEASENNFGSGGGVQGFPNRGRSPVLPSSGAYCQGRNNVVLSDEESDNEKYLKLNIKSLSKVGKMGYV